MREILFRAKRTDNGEWVEGYFVIGKWYLDEKERYAILPTDLCFYPHCEINEWIEIDPETLCQYTGITDKNGNRIWENDIVSGYFNHKKITGFIKYGSNAVYYIEREGSYGIHLDNSEDWLEVIGNIFDNPELLKGE